MTLCIYFATESAECSFKIWNTYLRGAECVIYIFKIVSTFMASNTLTANTAICKDKFAYRK